MLPIDSGLITNIFSNLIHFSENAPIPFSIVPKKKSEVDLLQCYVSNPNPTIPICIAHLPPDFQAFTRTLFFSLGLHLLGQTKHNPMHLIPNFNIMNFPHELLQDSRQLTQERQENKKTHKSSTTHDNGIGNFYF